MSLLIGGMAVTGRVRQQTDQYESLRLAATLFQTDARPAYSSAVFCSTTYIWLYTSSNMSTLTEYSLESQPSGLYDLHRRQWINVPASGVPYAGGTMVNDYTVAQGINQPTQSGDVFGCAKNPTYQQGEYTITLEKPLLSGQTVYTTVQAYAFPRNK
jgi:hypothetical protein